MSRPFGVRQFHSLLLAGSFTVLAGYIVRLSDSVIAGNLLGADAFAGVNLVAPVLSAVSFLSGLVATGMATHYSIWSGRLDLARARQFCMQALWMCLVLGGALALAILFGRTAYLSFFGADAVVTAHASDYLRWVWPVAVLDGLEATLVALGYADGDARLCAASYVVEFTVNALVSVLAVSLGMGLAGCALGSVVSLTAGILTMGLHFRKKTNTFRPVRHFSVRDGVRIVSASFGDAAAFLCDAALFFFLNKFVIMSFGSSVLPVVGVATALWGFLELFNGIGVAIQPIVTVYYGEGNTGAIRRVMRSAMRVATAEGLGFAAVFGAFPGLVVRMVGIDDPDLVARACLAVRIMSVGFVPLAFAGLYNSYYMFVERPLLAGVVTFCCYLFMPIACVAACSLAGIGGVWVGIGIGPLAGAVLSSLFIVATGNGRLYPFLLPADREARIRQFDFDLDERSAVETSRQVAGVLTEAGLGEELSARASLVTEEVLMVVRERNAGRAVCAEVTLDLNPRTDGARVALTVRDDGEIFDITDADAQVSSLRTFLVASVMERQTGRLNLVTTGFNRNVFRF